LELYGEAPISIKDAMINSAAEVKSIESIAAATKKRELPLFSDSESELSDDIRPEASSQRSKIRVIMDDD
jgi:hypothetical protein